MKKIQDIDRCPFCNSDSESFIKLQPNGTGVVKSGVKIQIKHADLEFVVCKECGSVLHTTVLGLEKLL